MITDLSKNMLLPVLLEILSTRSDAKHPLSQKKILEILGGDYGMVIDRKTLSRNLRELIAFCDGRIETADKQRSIKDAETGENVDTPVLTDIYMAREFEDSELMALIYSVIFSKHIPVSYKRNLIQRLEKLGSLDLHTEMSSFAMLPCDDESGSKELFLNMETLHEAIRKKKKAVYRRKIYGAGKKPVILEEEITFTPFKIAEKNDNFYVIGARDTDRLYRERIDSMTGVKIMDEPGLDLYKLKGIDKSFDFSSFLSKSPTLVPGRKVHARLRIIGFYPLSAAIDYFGPENIVGIQKKEPQEGTAPETATYSCQVNCSEETLYSWVLNPFNRTEVIAPARVRGTIRDILWYQNEVYQANPRNASIDWDQLAPDMIGAAITSAGPKKKKGQPDEELEP